MEDNVTPKRRKTGQTVNDKEKIKTAWQTVGREIYQRQYVFGG